ncbi:J domain-containing protein [Nocardioides sp. JQ2195]|uniref:J domain-containing protein n=1 Tax=Nocardioides sp. JQ2195 TaxID=2592334 RepID=UPI00143E5A0B|nr:DnaJ domain-containing protein [Nocardioides sp. JQ2195]QIX28052.1 J domain-containing protein [Nocardioides sp. JQ2195]
MSANWYDLLGVERSASSDEIRTAWKGSIADLDPTDHRFGLYNRAAGVLLDEDKRAAYDEELGPESSPEPDVSERDDPTDGAEQAESSVESHEADAPVPVDASGEPTTGAVDEPAPERSAGGRDVPVWMLALLLVATLAAAGGAFWLQRGSSDPDEVEADITAARAAAEQSVPKVLTYDHRYPERDHDAAMQVLTGEVATSYDKIWNDAILPNLEKVKGAAVTQVIGSGVVRASEGGDLVELVVVLSSRTTNKNTSTNLPPIPMTVKMVHEDGAWLIQDMDLWQPASADQESDHPPASEPGQN